MHVVFLSARLPLTKTFARTNGVLAATPYPHVTRVTSHHAQAGNLAEFHALLKQHAGQGHCLFGGQLNRPIQAESRAGLTAKTQKEWVCFDFDKVEASDHKDVVARYLPPECQQVSYIAQLSASMFRPDVTTWSGHVFMLLDKPCDELRLKQWFEHLNFNLPALRSQVSLTDSQTALHWPLDRTVAYNSKLIFIAPPRCYGFKPEIDEPIALVKKRKDKLSIPAFQPVSVDEIRGMVNGLRTQAGLTPLTYNLTPFEDGYVLDDAGEITVHDVKTSGDHFLRFNLNGGDSYAYFIDLRRPELIRNFKGEPYLKTEDAAPELWKSLRKVAPRALAKQPLDEGVEVLAFYATNQNSQIKIGMFDPGTNSLVLNNSGQTAASAWQAEYGLPPRALLPHMDLVFDPQVDVPYVTGTTVINTFKATEYMTRSRTNAAPSALTEIPTTIDKVLRSMLGDPSPDVYKHFVNWLAYVYQFRRKTGTAWVMSGVEGTGKGTFVKYVLTPIFGASAVRVVQFGLLNQEYNDFIEQALFVVFDEADVNAGENQAALMAKLRHYITDDPVTIRKMRTDPYPAASFANFMFMTNKNTPVQVTGADRRFNFAERQEKRLYPTPNEMKLLQTGAELDGFADVLQRWPVDELAVTRLVETQARQTVHESTTSINQLIADAVMQGDLQFFFERMPSDAEAAADFNNRFSPIGLYRGLLDRFAAEASEGQKSVVKDEDLFILFRTLIPDTRFFQDSKTWRMRHYKSLGLPVDKQIRVPGKWGERARGVLIDWRLPEGYEPPIEKDNVTSIKPKSRGKAR